MHFREERNKGFGICRVQTMRGVKGGCLRTAALALLPLFLCPPAAWSEPSREARDVLNQAVTEFRLGLTNKAAFHLNVAQGLDQTGLENNADYHRLRGFMAMYQGDREGAAQSFTKSLRLRDDAFLSYILGVRGLSLSVSTVAGFAFEQAALKSDTSPAPQSTDHDKGFGSDGTLLNILPIRCYTDVASKPAPGKPGL
ncbi:MAG: hypothetical protein HY042_11790, partial [Spirochaetia bacterium]|nr:hypothetical protein [Spirochaetia bacterium]